MDARQAEDYLVDLELFGMRFGLERMERLTTALGRPQDRFASIHVVGTNGKTSTTRMIAAILERHGVRSGSYTSPHLRGFAERIEVAGRPVTDAQFAAAVTVARAAADELDGQAEPGEEVTQFEALTAAAFHELARRDVEVAVIEAGLGGRFDATNVIPSSVTVLTSIGLDHTRWLGPALEDIAAEKLDVLREGSTLVTAELPAAAEAVAERIVAERGALRLRARDDLGIELRAAGDWQRRNFALAACAVEAFLGGLDDAAVLSAGAGIEVPGRLQVVAQDPLVVFDGAHNPDAAEALAHSLGEVTGDRPVVAVIAILDDKDAIGILERLLPLCSRVIFTTCDGSRARPPATLRALAEKRSRLPAEIVVEPRAALDRAVRHAGRDGAVLATGSLHLIADLVREPGTSRASML